jgi:hypothetical protein
LLNPLNNAPATIRDINKVAPSVINTIKGIKARKIHIIPGRVKIGINADIVVIVPITIGERNSLRDMSVAVFGENHCFTFSAAHSIMIIIVSIAIQKAKTNAKLVI